MQKNTRLDLSEFIILVDPHIAYIVRMGRVGKIFGILFTSEPTRCNTPASVMNKRSATKSYISAWVTRALKRKLVKLAKIRGESITELIENLLTKGTSNVELTSQDYDEIAAEVRAAEQGAGVRVHRRGTEEKG